MALVPKLLLFSFCSLILLHPQPSMAQSTVKAAYWFPDSGLSAAQIDSSLFTHLFCAFAGLDGQTHQVTIASSNQAAFASFTSTVQRSNPSVRTLLSIGGGSGDQTLRDAFTSMASQQASRQSFIDSSIRIARDNGFHGLDLDWEYPETPAEMVNLGSLLSEWRTAVASESQSTGRQQLLLTAAVYFSPDRDAASYPAAMLGSNLDWVNVMAYDFKGPGWGEAATGAPAALYNPSSRYSGGGGVGVWINAGMSANKMVFGLPFYGRAWRLVDPNQHGLGAPTNGQATGEGIGDGGAMSYAAIKEFINKTSASCVHDETVVTDYCYSGTTWVGFDGVESIAAKVSFARGRGLLGYFAWAVSQDSDWELTRAASRTWG